jgi:hypothetical protein
VYGVQRHEDKQPHVPTKLHTHGDSKQLLWIPTYTLRIPEIHFISQTKIPDNMGQ